MNVLLLWGEAMDRGFVAPIWMTFEQALELDAHVRKGERGSLVVYANRITKPTRNAPPTSFMACSLTIRRSRKTVRSSTRRRRRRWRLDV